MQKLIKFTFKTVRADGAVGVNVYPEFAADYYNAHKDEIATIDLVDEEDA